MFKEVPGQFDFPGMEREILAYWEAHGIYEKSLKQREGTTPFVFFEGPPTANGLPHPGHCLTRAMKDLFPRYKTMTGHYCLRKGGWDTHGLPVEVEVCKELGIHTKEEIEQYGVEKFNKKCLESVFRYTKEWEELTRRLGFWVNLDEAYVTYHQSYVESVWWALKTLFDAGELYQGHKIVWWWAQGGTALSAGEVGQGYREVDDPSVYVRFPLVRDERLAKQLEAWGVGLYQSRDGEEAVGAQTQGPSRSDADRSLTVAALKDAPVSLLVWTTTPWTLPSNTFAAVSREFEYTIVVDEETNERLIVADKLVESIAANAKKKWRREGSTFRGETLKGLRYVPPFREIYYDIIPDQWTPATFDDSSSPVQPYPSIRRRRWGDVTSPLRNNNGEDYPAWRILLADFVTLDSGTGLVHEAPAFGEVDYDLLQRERSEFIPEEAYWPPLLNAVAPNGTFNIPEELDEFDARKEFRNKYHGRWVKDCDKDIIRDLKERGLLLHQEQYRHDYPFCWRAEDDPLIQYPRKSWFIRTTRFKEAMLANNERINWLPDHIKSGRFGKFLESNVDWSLSRERYWGTPLPIWVCDACGHSEAVDSYDALVARSGVEGLEVWEQAKRDDPSLSDHLKVHKPYIDAITFDCPKCGEKSQEVEKSKSQNDDAPHAAGRMRRVPEVIDCWFDSGAMPFAQWGYPHRGVDEFESQFPADFISEALDQTRGWFYSLTAIATMLFGKDGVRIENAKCKMQNVKFDYPLPFRSCIVLGLLMGEDGLKMSKSKKNYKEPGYIFDHEGADAMRWLMFSGQTPWTSIRFQESAIAEAQREFLIRLYNCYSFFVIYANIDQWTPGEKSKSQKVEMSKSRNVETSKMGLADADTTRNELDRWIRSELAACSVKVFDSMEAYDNFTAAGALIDFVDSLSNWYVRRSRDRFWRGGMDDDKRAAYETLYNCLVTTAKLIAPFTPFIAESMYQNLVVEATRARSDEQSPERERSVNDQSRDCEGAGSYDSSRSERTPSLTVGARKGAVGARKEGMPPESVHLCDYPITAATRDAVREQIDAELNEEIELVRQVVSCGRAARSAARLRVRQPLGVMEIFHRRQDVIRRHEALIMDELNVKRIEFVAAGDIDQYVHYEVKPDFRKLGPKFGPLAPKIKGALAKHPNVDAIVKQLEQEGAYTLTVEGQSAELSADELQVELHAREGWSAQRIPGQGILVLDTQLTDALLDEGFARDLVNQIQQQRKAMNLRYEQRIDLAVAGDDFVHRIVNGFASYIQGETLAQSLLNQPIPGVEPVTCDLDGHAAKIFVNPLD